MIKRICDVCKTTELKKFDVRIFFYSGESGSGRLSNSADIVTLMYDICPDCFLKLQASHLGDGREVRRRRNIGESPSVKRGQECNSVFKPPVHPGLEILCSLVKGHASKHQGANWFWDDRGEGVYGEPSHKKNFYGQP